MALEEEQLRAAELLLEVVPRLWRLIYAQVQAGAEGPLSIAQLRVLSLLSSQQQLPSELARELRITPATTSEIVDLLVRRGLVVRGESPQDRRCTPLRITAEGMALLVQVRARALAAFRGLLHGSSAADLAEVTQGCAKLLTALQHNAGREAKRGV